MSWTEVFERLKSQGLDDPPMLDIGDGALGFWKAVSRVWPETRHQRCWTHKCANVLNRFPKAGQVAQAAAKSMVHDIWMGEGRAAAEKAIDLFEAAYGAKYPKAVECLTKDRTELLAFYDFPAEHWRHLRTRNPIESTFATVRQRTSRTTGCGSRSATLAMVLQLALSAQNRWRRLNGHPDLSKSRRRPWCGPRR